MLFVARLPVFARGGNQTARAPGTLPYSLLSSKQSMLKCLQGTSHSSLVAYMLALGLWQMWSSFSSMSCCLCFGSTWIILTDCQGSGRTKSKPMIFKGTWVDTIFRNTGQMELKITLLLLAANQIAFCRSEPSLPFCLLSWCFSPESTKTKNECIDSFINSSEKVPPGCRWGLSSTFSPWKKLNVI